QISGTVGSAQIPSAGGDLSGTLSSATVSRLQNRPMSTAAPSSGQVLTWNGSQWMPQAVPSGGLGSGGLNSVDKSLVNTYTAGEKQVFVPRLSNRATHVTAHA